MSAAVSFAIRVFVYSANMFAVIRPRQVVMRAFRWLASTVSSALSGGERRHRELGQLAISVG